MLFPLACFGTSEAERGEPSAPLAMDAGIVLAMTTTAAVLADFSRNSLLFTFTITPPYE
jgi:hypothetical protein